MTDDDKITELFQAAASDAGAPPPKFDHNDVVAVSRRITARRRSAVIGGAVALLVLAGVGTVATLPRSNTSALTTAAPAGTGADSNAAGPAAAAGAPEAAVGGVPAPTGADSAGRSAAATPRTPGSSDGAADGVAPGAVAPGGSAAAGGGAATQPSGVGTPAHPLGPGTTLCADRQDPALRALVVAVLPEVAHATGAATSDICLPGSQRYLSVELGGGVLTVAYLPPGTAPSLSDGASSAPTASKGTVIVSPAPGYADRAPELLQYLAPRL